MLHERRIAEQIDAYATGCITDAHPDADAARKAEQAARTVLDRAKNACTRLDTTLYTELRPYRRAAHITDPAKRLTTVTNELAGVEHALTTATTRADRLQHEPAIRALPAGGLDTEHDRWAADRAAQREAAARQAQEDWQRQQQPHRTRPNHLGHPAPDHGPRIG